ncbi:MAG: carbohydrate kinase, partial [Sphingopyxis sp.]
MAQGVYIVVDIGKTLSKVTLWSRDGQMLDRQTRPNAPQTVESPPINGATTSYTALDIDGIGQWLIGALARLSAHRVEAIIPVAHGAAFVALIDGAVAFPPPDYE